MWNGIQKFWQSDFYHDDRVKLEYYIKALICSELKRIEISEKQSKNLITYSIIIQKLLDFLE